MGDLNRSGNCLCGKINFEVSLCKKAVHICHCHLCQKWGGGPGFAVQVEGDWQVDGAENLTWFASSEWAQRGFCKTCGTHIFFKTNDGSYHGVTANIDNLDDLKIEEHIFVDSKPDYYDFADDSPRLTEEEFLVKIGAS